jgi:hypothetical protein
MKAIFPRPAQPQLFHFIMQNNLMEHIEIGMDDINKTLERKWISPYVAGHLSSINYLYELLNDPLFPAKDNLQWANSEKSHENLYWLRNIHQKLTKPIVDYFFKMAQTPPFSEKDCGTYRLNTRVLAMRRPLPKPTTIKPLMHLWYQQIGTFHLSILSKLKNPDKKLLLQIEENSLKAHIQLQCIHPFVDGTGRSARLVENLLRLRWGLPWKNIEAKNKQKYVNQIMEYEDGPEWQSILKRVGAK